MSWAEKLAALRQGRLTAPPFAELVKRVWGEGFTYRELEPGENWEVAVDSDFTHRYNWDEAAQEAAKEMRKENRRERTAQTRALNKALRSADLDPTHFKRLVVRHHNLSAEEFARLIELYKQAPDRNEFSKQQHTDL